MSQTVKVIVSQFFLSMWLSMCFCPCVWTMRLYPKPSQRWLTAVSSFAHPTYTPLYAYMYALGHVTHVMLPSGFCGRLPCQSCVQSDKQSLMVVNFLFVFCIKMCHRYGQSGYQFNILPVLYLVSISQF